MLLLSVEFLLRVVVIGICFCLGLGLGFWFLDWWTMENGYDDEEREIQYAVAVKRTPLKIVPVAEYIGFLIQQIKKHPSAWKKFQV